MQVLYCLKGEGRFPHLARFETRKEQGPVKLGDIVDAAFEIAQADVMAIVIAAETAGLVGAALRRSPASEHAGAPFAFPAVREWLSYSPERTHERSLALVVGIASRAPSIFDSMIRPIGRSGSPSGHFHAAAFSYRPLKKGLLDLNATVGMLFETEHVATVMHLVNDAREITGAGESEFVRGACWFGPVKGAS